MGAVRSREQYRSGGDHLEQPPGLLIQVSADLCTIQACQKLGVQQCRLGLGYDGGEGVAFSPSPSQLFIATDNGGGQTSCLYVYKVQ